MFATGHIKRNPATGAVAIRTRFPDDEAYGKRAWQIANVNVAPRSATTDEVAGWDDLFVPEAAS
jgi:hypothetical protein